MPLEDRGEAFVEFCMSKRGKQCISDTRERGGREDKRERGGGREKETNLCVVGSERSTIGSEIVYSFP